MITIAYMTGRVSPMIEWFFDSLHVQTLGTYVDVRVVVVDFHKDHKSREAWGRLFERVVNGGGEVLHVEPKPTVWQGKHRLTKVDYFAAANARNTALCLAPDGHIVYVDDLSVLQPGWWNSVREASGKNDTVTCGAYRKVLKLRVESGHVVEFENYANGNDVRMLNLEAGKIYDCHPGWLYGCSLCAPVDAFLRINGWPEACDGVGYEDCITGIVLSKHGIKFAYDTRMVTWESEEGHHSGHHYRRWDKGVSPNDKSHAILRIWTNASKFDNYFGDEGIIGLRRRVLAGDPFPIVGIPEHDWFDAMPLREM